MIWSPPFMRSYQSNVTTEPHQQPPTEEQSIKKDLSQTEMPATSNQMSDQGIQTDIIFIQKSQAVVSEAKSFDNSNLIIKPISPILSPKEEKLKLTPLSNRGEFSVESGEIEQSLALKEVSPAAEIFEERTNH